MTAGGDAEDRTDTGRDEAQTDLPRLEAVGSLKGHIDVGRDSNQETDSHGLDQRSPQDGGQADQTQRTQDELEEALVREGLVEDLKLLEIRLVRRQRARSLLDVGGGRDVRLLTHGGRGAVDVLVRKGLALADVRRLGKGEEGDEQDEADQGRGDLVDDAPVVVDGDDAADDHAEADADGEEGGVQGHDGAALVEEEDVGDGDGGDGLGRAGAEAHQDAAG